MLQAKFELACSWTAMERACYHLPCTDLSRIQHLNMTNGEILNLDTSEDVELF
jgi:hypothetical protein